MGRRTLRRGITRAARSTIWAVVALLHAAGGTAQATPGQVEINQVRALAGGVTPNDTPGFPVTIDTPGSYLLTSNLVVPNTVWSAIRVVADDVTIDLNGFMLQGPVTCDVSSGAISCTGASGGVSGVRGSGGYSGTTVRNGTIQGFQVGTWLGNECAIEGVVAWGNELDGLLADRHCRIVGNVVFRNGRHGIAADRGSVIEGNASSENGGAGIRMPGTGAVVRHNTTSHNEGNGLVCFRDCVVRQNAVYSNDLDGVVSTGDGTLVDGNAVCSNDDEQIVLSSQSGFVGNVVAEGLRPGGLVTGGVYMQDNLCEESTGGAACATTP